jgi:hypothetical protein
MHGANMKIERKALTRISNKQFYVTNETATQPTDQQTKSRKVLEHK